MVEEGERFTLVTMADQIVSKYVTLVRILDTLRREANGTQWEGAYDIASTDPEFVQQARGRAFIHLYLKVMFGVAEFAERQQYVTDGPQDGGVDGYFIDKETRRVHFLQSKFRNTETNFEQKEIEARELLSMDIDRIVSGYVSDCKGVDYNGKIKGLIRRISEIPDIARYNYDIAILANCSVSADHLRKLTDGYRATVFNFERSYNELLFPIVAGTYFRAQDVTIHLDLSNKSAGAKTNYSVATPDYQCEITVLFVPTIEIARTMDKYRNTLLEYNPRSYLDLDGQQVNSAIRETLLRPDSNEFALMNNGITILSDETNLNEKIGQHNKAQLRILRPQIINGGQTAYTLSRIYNEDKVGAEKRFGGKEVLTKIITLTPNDCSKDTAAERLRLIDEISYASNRQTPVIGADRISNESIYMAVQKKLFNRYGIFYERKRGEFSDGVLAGYVDRKRILERNLFLRIFFASRGQLNEAKKRKIFLQHGLAVSDLTDDSSLDLFVDGYNLFNALAPRNVNNVKKYRNVLAKVYIGIARTARDEPMDARVLEIEKLWNRMLTRFAAIRSRYANEQIDRKTGERRLVFAQDRWMVGREFERDVVDFVKSEPA